MQRIRWQQRRKGMQMAEFPIVLFILFLMLFPLLNLVVLGCGACTVWLIAQQTAATAAEQKSFADSLTAASGTANQIAQSGMSKWVKLAPVGGWQSSGVNLFVEKTAYKLNDSGQYWLYGPNCSAPVPAQASDYIYSIKSEATFNVGPFMSMAGIPFVGDIPGIGVPAAISITCGKAVEEPDHIVTTSNNLLASSGTSNNVSAQPGGWKSPNGVGELWTDANGNPIATYTVWQPDYPGATSGFLFKVDMQMVGGGGRAQVAGRYVNGYVPSSTGYILTGNQFAYNGTNGQTQYMGVNPGQNVDAYYEMPYCIGAAQACTDLVNVIQSGQTYGDSSVSMPPTATQATCDAIMSAHSWLTANMPQGWY